MEINEFVLIRKEFGGDKMLQIQSIFKIKLFSKIL